MRPCTLLLALLFALPVSAQEPPEASGDGEIACGYVPHSPVLIGGLEALHARVETPRRFRGLTVRGTVFVQFIVTVEGRVEDPVIARGFPREVFSEDVFRALEAAAVHAVSESRFEPGQQRGQPVAVRFTVPVRFGDR